MNSATPFNKILVANRGEIALRVMRTAQAMGYRTVAVYSSADADSLHVACADQAVCIGGPLPAESYLNIEAIIAAAKSCSADAVHPGYGFLAENAAFARACRDAGLVFIGPSAESIEAMGNKAGAKRLMVAAGVPCIPGYEDDDQRDARLLAEAERIGFPVMIKAAAGGGGRGMRCAEAKENFAEWLNSARSEAQSAFGDATIILERAVNNARHIEIQIFADRHGNAIHLGERDCSVQRRHQKLIEESPSPAVSPRLRERMGEIALKAVKAIGYEGASTLEFLLDEAGDFYFMEMNTRLQVEHAVTEAITGLDLVAMQLQVAAGNPLGVTQSEIAFDGHAIEVRLCAEDAAQSFMPQSGTMARWIAPSQLRVESALRSGSKIEPYYDSMIAKLVAHGKTRDEARRKLIAGLEALVALGVTTNQTFLTRCLNHPVFTRGEATTAFIGGHLQALLELNADLELRATAVAAMLLRETVPGRVDKMRRSVLRHRFAVPMKLAILGKTLSATLRAGRDGQTTVLIGERRFDLELIEIGTGEARFICAGVVERAVFHREESHIEFRYAGHSLIADDQSLLPAIRGDDKIGDGSVRASMSGRVVAIQVAVGERVSAGQPLIVIEAMKMEHIHRAPFAGTVGTLHVALRDQVPARRIVADVIP